MKKKRILRAISNKMKIIKGQKSKNTEKQVNIWKKKLFYKKTIKIERTLTSLIKAKKNKNKKREREKVQVKWQVSGKKKENFLQIQQT